MFRPCEWVQTTRLAAGYTDRWMYVIKIKPRTKFWQSYTRLKLVIDSARYWFWPGASRTLARDLKQLPRKIHIRKIPWCRFIVFRINYFLCGFLTQTPAKVFSMLQYNSRKHQCVTKVDSSLNHALIIQFFKVYRLEGKWVLGHAVFGGVVHHGMSRNFSLGCRIDQQV